MSEEIWKDIPECSTYQASTFGRIRNKETGKVLKPCISERGYEMLHLRYDSKSHTRYVHKLVAETFLPNPENKPEVNHEDGVKTNNRVDNLSWVTHSENNLHAYRVGLKTPSDKVREHARKMGNDATTRQAAYDRHPNIMIVETGEIYESNIAVAKRLQCHVQEVWACLHKKRNLCRGHHLEYTNTPPNCDKQRHSIDPKPFLYDFQMEAVNKAFNGCIFNGSVGSGKSRTGLFYYFKEQGGWIEGSEYTPMTNPKDLYIITTAMKRDKKEWEQELIPFRMTTSEQTYYPHRVVIDSWNNIQKYTDVKNSFFVWDEDRVTGSGAWVKAFLKIVKNNDWILLSATAGDVWMDYWAVFVANGFYKNKTDFCREHIVYSRYSKYPKVDRYVNTQRLMRLRNKILIDMTFERHTKPHHEDVYCNYDIPFYKDVVRRRWDPYRDEPIQQASSLCYILRRIVNTDESRQVKLLELLEDHPRAIIFYNFDYEREILLNLGYGDGTEIAEWSGHAHQPLPTSDKWVYLVQYTAGCEGWCAITTDTMIFFSQNYSYKVMTQASGRIDRLNTKFVDLYYYHLKSRSGIDLAISKALREKKKFNEQRWLDSWK